MIETGIIRKIDDVGKIVIPNAIRVEAFKTVEIKVKSMEIFYEEGGTIILKPTSIPSLI